MAKKMTYNSALEEINLILKEIENGEIDVDSLEQKLFKAKELFNYCEDKLRNVEKSVNQVLDDEKKE